MKEFTLVLTRDEVVAIGRVMRVYEVVYAAKERKGLVVSEDIETLGHLENILGKMPDPDTMDNEEIPCLLPIEGKPNEFSINPAYVDRLLREGQEEY